MTVSNFSDSFTRSGSHLLSAKLFVWAYNESDAYQRATANLDTLAFFNHLDAPVESHRVTKVYDGFWRVDFATDGSLAPVPEEEDEGHVRDYPLTD